MCIYIYIYIQYSCCSITRNKEARMATSSGVDCQHGDTREADYDQVK